MFLSRRTTFLQFPLRDDSQDPEFLNIFSNSFFTPISHTKSKMNTPANVAIREQRRRSTPLDIEQINISKALTAAEYSRRQFVLNYAASRDTQLLIPGKKADAIKQAEEWTASWLSQNGYSAAGPMSDFFKYTVDTRLWATLGSFPASHFRQEGANFVDGSRHGHGIPLRLHALPSRRIHHRLLHRQQQR